MLKTLTPKIKQMSLWGLGFLFCIFLDQLSKFLVANPFRNYFFAFSIVLPVWVMYAIYFVVMIMVFLYLKKNFFLLGKLEKLAWLFISAGAIANIGERMVLGYVRDFIYISFSRWVGIYNFADGYIIVGVIILLLSQKKFFK